jgi:hypothetical protein
MFLVVEEYFDKNEHIINTDRIVHVYPEKGEEYFVIELDDSEGSFVRASNTFYLRFQKTLLDLYKIER